MEQPLERPDVKLLAYLDGVCARLHRVCESEFVHDPEDTGAQLDLDGSFIEQSVDAVMSDLELASRENANLNDLVNTASRQFQMSSATPFAINTKTAPGLPNLRHSPELLLAIVKRSIQITADMAGPDRTLRLSTSHLGENVLASIETDVSEASSKMPIHLRTLTLADLVQRIGGDIQVECSTEVVRLTLTFETRARVL